METVKVRNLQLGAGIPKICVPIVGSTKEEILEQAGGFADIPADIAEWRADWFEGVFCPEEVVDVLGELRVVLKDTPILFTFRTAAEGGEKEVTAGEYMLLNETAASSGYADLLDAELSAGETAVKELIKRAHRMDVKVIASNHDFAGTPEKEEIIRRLRTMQDWGADILKIAVMPRDTRDLLTLLDATEEMNRCWAHCPVITMAMAGEGVLSRVSGEIFGSAVTFGAAGKASAPGQMPVEELRTVLRLLHKNM